MNVKIFIVCCPFATKVIRFGNNNKTNKKQNQKTQQYFKLIQFEEGKKS